MAEAFWILRVQPFGPPILFDNIGGGFPTRIAGTIATTQQATDPRIG